MLDTNRYQKTKQITLWGALVNFVLSLLKLGLGWVSGSHALVADGVHSLSDLGTDAFVIFAAKASQRSPDGCHPYGHGRIETIAVMGLSLVLAAIGFFIIYDGVSHLFRPLVIRQSYAAMAIAILSIVLNEGLFYITRRVSQKIDSKLLYLAAWHRRVDSLSSMVVLVGMVGSLWISPCLDSVAAIVIGIMIIKATGEIAWKGLQELSDRSADANIIDRMMSELKQVQGILGVHQLRTRLVNHRVFVDMHIEVLPNISVSESHYIADQAERQLKQAISQIQDVVIHIDIEPDNIELSRALLPNREIILQQLRSAWKDLPAYSALLKMNLHYVNGSIEVEVYFSAEKLKAQSLSIESLIEIYRHAARFIPNICKIVFYLAIE